MTNTETRKKNCAKQSNSKVREKRRKMVRRQRDKTGEHYRANW